MLELVIYVVPVLPSSSSAEILLLKLTQGGLLAAIAQVPSTCATLDSPQSCLPRRESSGEGEGPLGPPVDSLGPNGALGLVQLCPP